MDKKNILIIGAGSDIGEAFISISDYDALDLYCHYRKEGSKQRLSITTIIHEFTIKNIDEFARLLPEVKFDGVIFLIGATDYTFFSDLTAEQWIQSYSINVVIPSLILKALRDQLNQSCSVVFIGSYTSNIGQIGMTHYVAAKSAMKGLVKSLAKELSHLQCRVNLIEPHLIETKKTTKMPNKIKESYIDQNLSRRLGKPIEIANTIKFLISEESSYLNGSIIEVSGGHDY